MIQVFQRSAKLMMIASSFARVVPVAKNESPPSPAPRGKMRSDGRFADVAIQQLQHFQVWHVRAVIHVCLLRFVAAKRAQRFVRIDQPALKKKMKPHFQIDDLPKCRIETAVSRAATKHDRRGLSDEITAFAKAARDHLGAVVNSR